MSVLANLESPNSKRTKRVGRGPGSKMGKTSCRGHKGQKSRSGYKRRSGQEGGQLPLYRKLPTRGFSNARFKTDVFALNLDRISELFEDGEIVSMETLISKRLAPATTKAKLKILGGGEITKKLIVHAHLYSHSAIEKLEKATIEYKRHD